MRRRNGRRQLLVRARIARREARRWARTVRSRAARGAERARTTVVALRPGALAVARAGLRISILVVIASVALASGAFAASRLYAQFGAPRAVVSERAWAERPVRYQVASCASCHSLETTAAASGRHATVRCETCHGALEGHPGSGNVHLALAVPPSSVCLACHAATPGRPGSIPQVDRASHFPGAECLGCHDPHEATAAAPPEVMHPLANLPVCTTCHRSEGLRKMPFGHELVEDRVCLACHKVPEVLR